MSLRTTHELPERVGSINEAARVDVGVTELTAVNIDGALGLVERNIAKGRQSFYCFCEANLLSHAIRESGVRRVLGAAEAVFADGVVLTWLARIHGGRLPGRVPGPSFLLAACGHGLDRGWRHFFYGSTPLILEQLTAELESLFPGVQIAGRFSPPFRPLTEFEEQHAKEAIEAARPHLLWIGLGGPKQEIWAAEHLGKINVPAMLCVGAAFDFHAGSRPWAPAWVRRVGLEWVFRTVTGGRRTFSRNMRCLSNVGLYASKVAMRSVLGLPLPSSGDQRRPRHRKSESSFEIAAAPRLGEGQIDAGINNGPPQTHSGLD